MLHEVEELSAPQISAIPGVPLNTVCPRLREAHKILNKAHARQHFLGRAVR